MENEAQTAAFNEECRVTARLLDLMNETHYNLVQENGQRRLTSPDLTPELRNQLKGAEVFLGRLPRNCYEDELVPVVTRAGKLLELRLMLDFSGTTRGYAFALFESSKVARKACEILDGFEIREGHKIGVVKSIDNCRLFFGGVPKDKSKEEFVEELGKFLDGISNIYLYPHAQDKTLNRGFIFVEFKDHRSAAMARRQLIPGRVSLWDHEVAVDWADPEPGDPVDEDVMETVSALFIRNLDVEAHHNRIREIFQKTTGIPILKLKKINHFAFIHYETRDLAKKVMDCMSRPGGVAEQNGWEICWAKPISSAKQHERQRSINEAVQASLRQNLQPRAYVPPRSGGGKRGKNKSKQSAPSTPELPRPSPQSTASSRSSLDSPVPPMVDHVVMNPNFVDFRQLLEDFVMRRFGAHCQLHCMHIFAPPGFVCKISIVRDDHILYEFQGDLMPTQALAINLTSQNVYYRLTTDFGDAPMYPAPIHPQSAYQPNRVQPCH